LENNDSSSKEEEEKDYGVAENKKSHRSIPEEKKEPQKKSSINRKPLYIDTGFDDDSQVDSDTQTYETPPLLPSTITTTKETPPDNKPSFISNNISSSSSSSSEAAHQQQQSSVQSVYKFQFLQELKQFLSFCFSENFFLSLIIVIFIFIVSCFHPWLWVKAIPTIFLCWIFCIIFSV
jgi:uncharacterized membrane protein (DUF485 family)